MKAILLSTLVLTACSSPHSRDVEARHDRGGARDRIRAPYDVHKEVLPNGLRALVVPRPQEETADSVQAWQTGPGFTSRITKRLRDELGLAYTV